MVSIHGICELGRGEGRREIVLCAFCSMLQTGLHCTITTDCVHAKSERQTLVHEQDEKQTLLAGTVKLSWECYLC